MNINYKDKQWKDRSKYKFKIQNKGTKTRTQKSNPKTQIAQDQSTNKFLLQWGKQT
jgi:hypothetical protein